MQGKLLQKLIQEDKLNLPRDYKVDDFETMYTLLLEARGIYSVGDITESEERLILIILCRIPLPGKTPRYSCGIYALLSNFRGISDDGFLREKFKEKISRRVMKLGNADNLSLSKTRMIFGRKHNKSKIKKAVILNN